MDQTHTESQLNTQENVLDQAKECTVCMADFDGLDLVFLTRCGHYIHDECLRNCLLEKLKKHEEPRCPVCRFVFVPLDQKNALPMD